MRLSHVPRSAHCIHTTDQKDFLLQLLIHQSVLVALMQLCKPSAGVCFAQHSIMLIVMPLLCVNLQEPSAAVPRGQSQLCHVLGAWNVRQPFITTLSLAHVRSEPRGWAAGKLQSCLLYPCTCTGMSKGMCSLCVCDVASRSISLGLKQLCCS